MLCENCGKNQANALVERNINGEKVSMKICSSCASKLGFSPFSNMFDFDFGTFLSGVMGGAGNTAPERVEIQRCPTCSSSLRDFTQRGKAGCANCYAAFNKQLLPSLMKIHGNVHHTGKIPQSAGAALAQKRQKAELVKRLDEAVAAQAFEEAARLRDEIRALDGGGDPR